MEDRGRIHIFSFDEAQAQHLQFACDNVHILSEVDRNSFTRRPSAEFAQGCTTGRDLCALWIKLDPQKKGCERITGVHSKYETLLIELRQIFGGRDRVWLIMEGYKFSEKEVFNLTITQYLPVNETIVIEDLRHQLERAGRPSELEILLAIKAVLSIALRQANRSDWRRYVRDFDSTDRANHVFLEEDQDYGKTWTTWSFTAALIIMISALLATLIL